MVTTIEQEMRTIAKQLDKMNQNIAKAIKQIQWQRKKRI